MKSALRHLFVGIVSVSSCMAAGTAAGQDQAAMDAACEEARETNLAPLRDQKIAECVAQGGKDQATCEAEFANYGARVGNKQALFYDLPECEAAFENKRKYRSAN